MSDSVKARDWKWSHKAPYLLDTEEKVKWANDRLSYGYPYRLGDHCPIRPTSKEAEA